MPVSSRGSVGPSERLGLLEREGELARWDDALTAAAERRGAFVVVEGPAGIGKTRLLGELTRRGEEAGFGVLTALGAELERAFAFGVARQLFERRLREADGAERGRLLMGAAGLVAEHVGASEATGAQSADAGFAALHGLYWLAANLVSETPHIVAVDDVHLADLPSLNWLSFLVRRLDGLRLVVVVARRTGEEGTDRHVVDQLAASPQRLALRPSPLSPAGVAEVLTAELGHAAVDELSRACWQVTGGNPFLLRELLTELAAHGEPVTLDAVAALGPPSVASAVSLRLSGLPAAATAVARAVAILGDDASLAHVAALADLPPAAAAEAADMLATAQILTAEPQLRFVHPIVRTAIEANLAPSVRAADHGRAARMHAADGIAAHRFAPHLVASQPAGDDWVLDRLLEAARWSLARGAPELAGEQLRRALAEPPPAGRRAEVLTELGTAEMRVAPERALEHFAEALELGRVGAAEWTGAAIALARTLMLSDRWAEAVDVMDRAIAALDDPRAETRLALECELAGLCRLNVDLSARRVQILRDLADRTNWSGTLERVVLANLANEAALAGTSASEAAALAERALAGELLLREKTGATVEIFLAAAALLYADRFDRARQAAEGILADARARGSLIGFSVACTLRARIALREGRLATAEADARAALDAAPAGNWLPLAAATLVDGLRERGRHSAARSALAAAPATVWRESNAHFAVLLYARGRLAIDEGDIEAGLADVLAAGARQTAWGTPNPAVLPWRSTAAPALASMGQEERAAELAAEELALAKAFGAPRAHGIALMASAALATGAARLQLLEDAVDLLAGAGAELETARALIRHGEALRQSRERSRAREQFRRGLELAERCGATPLAQSARRELRALGLRPRRAATTGLDSLTPSERNVAELVASGMTNRAAAQALFVTEKTIEAHLSSAYAKLRIRSRTQLARVLLGPRPPAAEDGGAARH